MHMFSSFSLFYLYELYLNVIWLYVSFNERFMTAAAIKISVTCHHNQHILDECSFDTSCQGHASCF